MHHALLCIWCLVIGYVPEFDLPTLGRVLLMDASIFIEVIPKISSATSYTFPAASTFPGKSWLDTSCSEFIGLKSQSITNVQSFVLSVSV